MKLFRNIQIFLWVMMPMVLMAQEMAIDWVMPLSKENTSQAVPIGPPVPGFGDTLYRNYIPYSYKSPLEVNINLFFIQKDNGTGSFQEDNAEHQLFWDEIVAGVSKKFTEIQNSNLDSCFAWNDPFLSDSRIRFKFNRHYLKDSRHWNWKLYGSTAWGISSKLDILKGELEQRNDIPLGISVFFPENGDVFDEYMDVIISGDTVSSKSADFAYTSYPGVNYISKICMPDMYCKFM